MPRRQLGLVIRLALVGIAVVSGLFVVLEVAGGYLIRGNMEQAAEDCFSLVSPPGAARFITLEVEGFPPRRVCRFVFENGDVVNHSEPVLAGGEYRLLAVSLVSLALLVLLRRRTNEDRSAGSVQLEES
ncbi:MAG: hypothetical protein M3273_00435 [Actinomycetota bacterium]|nr:hypothetical protein [Actinomycetota bacterium]